MVAKLPVKTLTAAYNCLYLQASIIDHRRRPVSALHEVSNNSYFTPKKTLTVSVKNFSGKIRSYFKENPYIISLLYNIFHCPSAFFVKCFKFTGAFLSGIKFSIKGKGNQVLCKNLARMRNCEILIIGNNNRIVIDENCRLKNLSLWIEGDNNEITIGEYTYIFGGELAALEGTGITIGKDCLFSRSIEFRTADSHKIFDESGHRINQAESINIGSHVWLGAHVKVLKGASVADGSVVGIGSIVTKPLTTPNAIYAGTPAKIIKEHISWSR